MWRMLRSLDMTYQKPERMYHEGSDQAREEWIRREGQESKCLPKDDLSF
jgi:transposase